MAKRINCIIRAVVCIAAAFLSLPILPLAAAEPPELVNADYAYLYSFENDVVLYEKNADIRIYPASTVKLMTALLSIEHFEGENGGGLSRRVTVEKAMLQGAGGNSIGLKDGEIVTARDLLHALIVGGSNDAALVLAHAVAGSVDGFVARMNERAPEIGAVNTTYANPTGLHHGAMYTTVADVAAIARYLYQYSTFRDIAAQSRYDMPATNLTQLRKIVNRNYFISTGINANYYWSRVNGMNAGSTSEAGYCLVATAENDDVNYLCVIMNAGADEETIYSYTEAKKLLSWAFENFAYKRVLESSAMICEIPVTMSANVDHVMLLAEHAVELFLPVDVDPAEIKRTWTLTETELQAPVEEGQVAGQLTLTYQGNVVGRVNLVTKSSIARSEFLYLLSLIEAVTATRWFKATVVAFVCFSLLYVLLKALIQGRKRSSSGRRSSLR